MKISRITVWQKQLRLKRPYFLSGGRLRFDELDATFVRIDTDNATYGWGEGTPWGHTYLPAHGPGIRAGIQTIPRNSRLGCWSCQDMIVDDPAPGAGPRNQDGKLRITDSPGMGVVPDADWLGTPCAVYE